MGTTVERKKSSDFKKKKTHSKDELTDSLGREFNFNKIVVNFCNVAASYSKKVMGKKDGDKNLFDWNGVRICVKYLRKHKKFEVTGVIDENFRGPDSGGAYGNYAVTLPDDINKMCTVQETPRITGRNHSSADDEMTIKCAYKRNCYFLDNDNYRDWLQQLRDNDVRLWLNKQQEMLQLKYYWDKELGTLELLEENQPLKVLAENRVLEKRE